MNQINGKLELKQKMYDKEFYELVEKYNLTIPQYEGFITAHAALENNLDHPRWGNRWEILSARRSITRIIYEASLNLLFCLMLTNKIYIHCLLNSFPYWQLSFHTEERK